MIGLMRRRIGISEKTPDIYAEFVKLKTKNVASGRNVLGAVNLSTVEKMLVDGTEITPTKDNYVFPDDNYHDVYILFKNITTIPNSAFMVANYTINYIDFPPCYTNFGNSSIRNLGASGSTTVIIRSLTYPTFGQYNNYGHTSGNLYVPDSLYDTYLENPVGF